MKLTVCAVISSTFYYNYTDVDNFRSARTLVYESLIESILTFNISHTYTHILVQSNQTQNKTLTQNQTVWQDNGITPNLSFRTLQTFGDEESNTDH